MQTRFLLGPAGSGKTCRCLAEIIGALEASPDGPPLLLIAPKQATFQLERQLLDDTKIDGFTRLHILSFERLAQFVFEHLQKPPPRLLDQEGRLMVLRALLSKRRDQLRLFRASARLNGFAKSLGDALHELQRQEQTPETIRQMAGELGEATGLSFKLLDLADILEDYLLWLKEHGLKDANSLLDAATTALLESNLPARFQQIWVDGFAEFSGMELSLLAAVGVQSESTTVALCLHKEPSARMDRAGHWGLLERTFLRVRKKFAALAGSNIVVEKIGQRTWTAQGHLVQPRYAGNEAMGWLEANWESPKPWKETGVESGELLHRSFRLVQCANPEAEAVLAAEEVLRFVRGGGRYREAAVLVRNLQPFAEVLRRVFTRYKIPFFLDQRENVSHHPLAELTRNALRTIDRDWEHADWFGALKTGLLPVNDSEIDRLENEALARGWRGEQWQHPFTGIDDPNLARALNETRRILLQPFNALAIALGNRPDGLQLASALRTFWENLEIAETLDDWSRDEKSGPNPAHMTVWQQMGAWLENIERAFPDRHYSLREWLSILDSGLSGLSVGVIPPMLDQVLVGAVDRSRNAELRLAVLLGMNEGVFPAPPGGSALLSEGDRAELESKGIPLPTARQLIGRERFLAYVMFTRSRGRLVVSHSGADADGKAQNESPFIGHFRRLFPSVEMEQFKRVRDWLESEHLCELTPFILHNQSLPEGSRNSRLEKFSGLPVLDSVRENLRHFEIATGGDALSPALAEALYGRDLKNSVSRMEEFAACPFKFFVHSGLGARERLRFEMDVRERGNFQHEILEAFHNHLNSEGKRWRDVTPETARELTGTLAAARCVTFKNGLLQATEEGRFAARMMTESLQDFVETLVKWMRGQYQFDPVAVEVPFDDKLGGLPSWRLDLGNSHRLLLNGRIDRVDVCFVDEARSSAWCAVIDYKSSEKKLDDVLMFNGLQLQLPAYLKVVLNSPGALKILGATELQPAGAFYVSLRGQNEKGEHRDESQEDIAGDKKRACAHKGRFCSAALEFLDKRVTTVQKGASFKGDQFNFELKKDGGLAARQKDGMQPGDFMNLLNQVETSLVEMGARIYLGEAKVDPYKHQKKVPCDHCDYRTVCRIDPWTHSYRSLKSPRTEATEE